MRSGLCEFNPDWLRRECDVRLWSLAELARRSGHSVHPFQRMVKRGRTTTVCLAKVLATLREHPPLEGMREVVEAEFGPAATRMFEMETKG